MRDCAASSATPVTLCFARLKILAFWRFLEPVPSLPQSTPTYNMDAALLNLTKTLLHS